MYKTKAVENRILRAMKLFRYMPNLSIKPILDGLICPYCESILTIKYGKTKCGGQRHRCKECHRTYISSCSKQYVHTDTFKKYAIYSWQLGVGGIRTIAKKFEVSTNSLYRWLPIYGKSYFPWPYKGKKKQYCYNSMLIKPPKV